jgi:hypothetical protein
MQEMALEFPHARIDGIDIEPPAPHLGLPSNCFFLQGNVLEGLPYPECAFDYVHQRLLVCAIPTYRWSFISKNCDALPASVGGSNCWRPAMCLIWP